MAHVSQFFASKLLILSKKWLNLSHLSFWSQRHSVAQREHVRRLPTRPKHAFSRTPASARLLCPFGKRAGPAASAPEPSGVASQPTHQVALFVEFQLPRRAHNLDPRPLLQLAPQILG